MSGVIAQGGWIAGLACMLGAISTAATAQGRAPDFSSNHAGWVATSNDFIPTGDARKPVTFDPACIRSLAHGFRLESVRSAIR